jgi:hypothetical protein
MTRQSCQHGYASRPISNRSGIVFKMATYLEFYQFLSLSNPADAVSQDFVAAK